MARKETVTKKMIQDNAFLMLQEEGIEAVTARKLATRIGCSTQPIFRLYENMSQLNNELFEMSMNYFEEYCSKCTGNHEQPFINLGLSYIQFASEEPNLFKILFLSKERMGKQLYELLNGKTEAVRKELMKAAQSGCKDPGQMFMKMWNFIHGAACMTITGDYDLNAEETAALLNDTYRALNQ